MVKTILKTVFVLILVVFLNCIIFEIICHKNINTDICIDSGICKKGLALNTENGKIIISEESCLENKGKWQEEKEICSFYY